MIAKKGGASRKVSLKLRKKRKELNEENSRSKNTKEAPELGARKSAQRKNDHFAWSWWGGERGEGSRKK